MKHDELEIKKLIEVERIRQELERAKLDLEKSRLAVIKDGTLAGEAPGGQAPSYSVPGFDVK